MTKEDKNKKVINTLAGSIILNQLALDHNEKLKHTPFYKQKLKQTLNTTIKELIKCESKEYDMIYNEQDSEVSTIYERALSTIELISEGSFIQLVEVGDILKAYKKDPKSMLGIIKKINKNGNN